MAIALGTDGYCEAADVQGQTGKTYTANTAPTTTEVETAITEEFHRMNGVLKGAGYAVPVPTSSAAASRILKAIARKLVGAFAENAVPGIMEPSARAAEWREQAELDLKRIGKGDMSLVDAPTSQDTATPPSDQNPEGEFNQDSDGDERDPAFDRDTDL
jgi:glyceraldehyde-3-phosphate dehydrogenase/erythrose-4-phosphate dehydrogenase